MSLPYFFLSFILASLFQLVYLSKFKYLRNFFFFSCKLRKVERFYLNFLFCKMIEYSFSLYREASSSLIKHSVERTCSEILAYRCKSVLASASVRNTNSTFSQGLQNRKSYIHNVPMSFIHVFPSRHNNLPCVLPIINNSFCALRL